MNENIELVEIPHNIELEQQILAMIIKDDKLIRDVVDSVTSETFYNKYHKEIFKAMLYLHYQNMSVGLETIVHRLQSKKVDDDLINYAIEVSGSHITYSSFQNKIDLLIDLKQKRDLYEHSLRVITKDISGISSTILVKQTKDVIENMGVNNNIEVDKFEDYVDDWLEYMEDDTPIVSHKLGFKLLDDIVLLENSNLMIIGARPSVGKSAFATNIVKNFCLQGKKPLFVSLEMNKKEYMNRLVSNMAHIPARKLKRKEVKTSYEWQRILQAKDKIKQFKFNFYDKGGMSIEQLVGLSRYLKKRDELDVLVIDYLQLLESNQYRGQKQNQVGYISQKLKQIAMELDIPVIALSQLSRGVIESGGVPREPQLSDLRDSGSLEQDANIVMMLHTTDIEQKWGEGDTRGRYIDLFVRKNRDGKLGTVKYEYFGDYVDFKEKIWDNDIRGFVTVEQDEVLGELDYPSDVPF